MQECLDKDDGADLLVDLSLGLHDLSALRRVGTLEGEGQVVVPDGRTHVPIDHLKELHDVAKLGSHLKLADGSWGDIVPRDDVAEYPLLENVEVYPRVLLCQQGQGCCERGIRSRHVAEIVIFLKGIIDLFEWRHPGQGIGADHHHSADNGDLPVIVYHLLDAEELVARVIEYHVVECRAVSLGVEVGVPVDDGGIPGIITRLRGFLCLLLELIEEPVDIILRIEVDLPGNIGVVVAGTRVPFNVDVGEVVDLVKEPSCRNTVGRKVESHPERR